MPFDFDALGPILTALFVGALWLRRLLGGARAPEKTARGEFRRGYEPIEPS